MTVLPATVQMRPRRLGRGVMKGRHLIPGVVALAFAAPAFAGEPPVGNWRIVEADYSDQGHSRAATKPLKRSRDRAGVVLDGILDSADFAGRSGPGHYLH